MERTSLIFSCVAQRRVDRETYDESASEVYRGEEDLPIECKKGRTMVVEVERGGWMGGGEEEGLRWLEEERGRGEGGELESVRGEMPRFCLPFSRR